MSQSRYEVFSTIGVGATSRVDKAHDTLIDRTVALKTFGHGFGSEELQKQFLREAQILGRLSHPNIVSIYDLGTNDDGSAYLVTEYVPGKTLESLMASQGALPLSRIGVWACDLANALNRAHRAGIIHGDVKPANIFVTDEGHIKLGDFGIARFATQLSGTGCLVGTPAYLSPEQIKGESQDHRSDIFSLGIILYQLATGVRPFDGSSVTAVCAQIVATEPPPPSHHNRELPKEFDRIVMRCLAKAPSARYASSESLAASLYPFAGSKPEVSPHRFDLSWWKRPFRTRDAWLLAGLTMVAMISIPLAYRLRRAGGGATDSSRAAKATQANVEPWTAQMTTAPNTLAAESRINSANTADRKHYSSPQGSDVSVKTAHAPSVSVASNDTHDLVSRAANTSPALSKPQPQVAPRTAATIQVPLSIEIASALDGETLAVYSDQRLLATAVLSVTSAGEKLHLERQLTAGAHELRVALYRPDQSLHMEREGLAELQVDANNTLSIQVLRHSKILVKHDAALEIIWPSSFAARSARNSVRVADASASTHNHK
jgi:serine/threonine protein kinase